MFYMIILRSVSIPFRLWSWGQLICVSPLRSCFLFLCLSLLPICFHVFCFHLCYVRCPFLAFLLSLDCFYVWFPVKFPFLDSTWLRSFLILNFALKSLANIISDVFFFGWFDGPGIHIIPSHTFSYFPVLLASLVNSSAHDPWFAF